MTHVRQSLGALKALQTQVDLNQTTRTQLAVLITCADKIIEGLGGDVTPFPSKNIMDSFLAAVRNARTLKQAQRVQQQTEDLLSRLGRSYLAEADIAFGQLKVIIGTQHRELDNLGWAVAI